MAEKMTCTQCGMPCDAGEYHPYAACLMFTACHNSETVRANLAQPAQAVDVGTAYVQAMVQVHEAKNHAIGNAQAAGWRDIATAPETGVFLVHLEAPMMGSLVHSANWRPNVKTIGATFSFDAPKATHWMPLPTPPTQDTPNAHE